ncbi:hypothetical protein AB1N83_012637 [Pleurotus pulmonarius]
MGVWYHQHPTSASTHTYQATMKFSVAALALFALAVAQARAVTEDPRAPTEDPLVQAEEEYASGVGDSVVFIQVDYLGCTCKRIGSILADETCLAPLTWPTLDFYYTVNLCR